MALRKLSPQDRVALYRVLAYEAGRGTDATTGSVRDSWAVVKRQWENLASKADVDAAAESEDCKTLTAKAKEAEALILQAKIMMVTALDIEA